MPSGVGMRKATDPPMLDGLSSGEVASGLQKFGHNAIADVAQHSLKMALLKLWAPVPWMLEAAILLQLVLGKYPEAAVVALLLVCNAALGLFQESRAQNTLDALKSRLALLATVRRDGRWQNVPAADLVPGDVIKLSLGAVVAADAKLVSGSVLLDQSMLTGESVPTETSGGADTYAGALVRRGEAVAVVTATGERTKFGRTAELVRTAHVEGTQQKAVLRVVANLVMLNGVVTVFLAGYAAWLQMPPLEIVSLVLVAVLSSIPVALPSMFTLAAAIGARSLARQGVLPTRLSAVDEAGGIDILCSDKTGTLTRNELAVIEVRALPGFDRAHVLALAALASSDAGQDPVDTAIQQAAKASPVADRPTLVAFVPFDPALKRSAATVQRADGTIDEVVKGAYAVIAALAEPAPTAAAMVDELQSQGLRVLALAEGPAGKLLLMGLIALSDPPRADSAALVAELKTLGVGTVMVTGDAALTAQVVARAVGISGKTWASSPLPDDLAVDAYTIFGGVLPEDKQHLVSLLQKQDHVVGMCGDGANDAPALRQAQMGIAVSTATDVAKSAAGIVLTEPGLAGIVTTVKEGRKTFQRVYTYALRSIVHKTVQVLFLTAGLLITGRAILTPGLMVLMMVIGDLLALSSATDNVRPSPTPNRWRIRELTIAGMVMGSADLLFCIACLSIGKFLLGLDPQEMQTLTVATLVFGGQAVFYVSRERGHLWSSRPGHWLVVSSVIDLCIIFVLASQGILMTAIPLVLLARLLCAAIVFTFVLDLVKLAAFRRLGIS